LKKEIGDIMLHLIFYSKIADEQGHFDMADVLEAIAEKMIFRHPHIYGDETVENEEQVKQNWEKLKQQEGKGKKATLEGVPSSLPPMVKAIRIQAKARGTGFDWENKDQVWDKVKEEILEFEQAETEEEREKEFGDLIFSLINYARFVKIEPEQALEKTNLKFIRRFNYLEEKIKASGKTLDEADITTMDQFWDEAKGKGL